MNPVHSEEPPGQPQELLSKVVYGLIMRRRGPGVDLQPRLFGQEPAHGSHDPFTGALFGVDYSTITRRFAVLEPIVAQVTGIKKDRTLKQDDLEILLIDATEQRIERPVRGQRKFYSGKKKCHTIKTEIQITEGGRIVAVSKPFPGAVHDIEVRRRGPPLPGSSRAYVDSGYQGLQKQHQKTELPYKRQKGKPLGKDEKQYNRALSRSG